MSTKTHCHTEREKDREGGGLYYSIFKSKPQFLKGMGKIGSAVILAQLTLERPWNPLNDVQSFDKLITKLALHVCLVPHA
jgi:hypothetical protein